MRWLARTLLVMVLLLGVGLAAAVFTRNEWLPPATKWAVNAWAAHRGAPDPVITELQFRLDDVSLSRASIGAVDVNGPGGFQAERIDLSFAWRDLIGGRLRAVTLARPSLMVTVTEAGDVSFGRLEPLRSLASGGGGETAPPPRVQFTDAEVTIDGATRGRVIATGTLGDSDGALGVAAEGSGALEGVDWRADGAGRLLVSLEGARTRINATLTEARVRRGDLSVEGLRGTASVSIEPSGTDAIADLRADSAEAAGVAVAVPSAHLRLDPLGMSAVFRLGDPAAPELRLALSADQADGERRPVAVDVSGDLSTLDQLVAAARREPPHGMTGRVEGTLRGTLPSQVADMETAWQGAVGAGSVSVDAAAPSFSARGRFGAALAAGTLALETLAPAQASVALPDVPPEIAEALGEGPLSIVLGRDDKAFRLSVREPFAVPMLSFGGPVAATADSGMTLHFDGDADLLGDHQAPALTSAAGTVTLRDLILGGSRVHEARLDVEALSGRAGEITGEGVLDVSADSGEVRDARAILPLRVVHDANGTAVFLRRSGSVRVPAVPSAGGVSIDGPLALRLDPARRAMIRRGFGDGDAIRLDVPFALPATVASIEGGAPATVALSEARGSIRARMVGARGGAVIRLTTDAVTVAPTDAPPETPDGVAFSGVALEIRAAARGQQVSIERIAVNADRMSDRATSVRFAPLRVEGQATRAAGGAYEFTSTFRGGDGAFVLDAKGFHDLATGAGRAYITLFPLVFVPGGLQPVTLSPAAAALLRNASGEVSLDGAVEWPRGDVPPDEPLTLTLKDFAFTGTLGTVSGLSGSVALSSIDPLTTLPGQSLSAKGIDVGVPIADPSVAFRLDPDLVLVLEKVRARFADGQVHTSDVRVPLRSGEPVSMVLDVEGVDASRLAEVTDLDGLTASGSLTGQLPLMWDFEQGLSLRRARLSATAEGGTVRYRPENPLPALQDAGEEVSLLLKAVRNLVYDTFVIEADGRPGEPFDIKLRVRGANPDLFDGYPVALNVSLSGRLDQMFLNARRTLGLSDVLRRKLEARNAGG